MDETVKIIRDYYDSTVSEEWERVAGRPEFLLTCRMLDRYINPGDTVLDIGGGPGRYSLYLAGKGCDVTLFDLSPENVKFGRERAMEEGFSIQAIAGDAREADKLIDRQFDHVLLMGPLYHLLEEAERVKAVDAALNLLKPGGLLFAAFINMLAGIIYAIKFAPEIIKPATPAELEYRESFAAGKSYAGEAFTRAFFIEQSEILPFMARFPLKKLHLFGQEGLISHCEANIMAQPKEIVDMWLDLSEKVWEREALLSWSEHLMYVGQKRP